MRNDGGAESPHDRACIRAAIDDGAGIEVVARGRARGDYRRQAAVGPFGNIHPAGAILAVALPNQSTRDGSVPRDEPLRELRASVAWPTFQTSDKTGTATRTGLAWRRESARLNALRKPP